MANRVVSLYGIQPEKLAEARKARGYNMADLGIVLGVTRQAVDKYESGKMSPSPDVLQRYIEQLAFPMSYFQEPLFNNEATKTAILYRSLATATAVARDKVAVRAEWMDRISYYLRQFVEFPKVEILPQSFLQEYSGEKIEQVAENLRREWGMGMGPIPNLTILLQNQGIFIARTRVDLQKTDACSRWVDKQPFAFLTSDKHASVCSRFDLAHELGHIILHYVADGELTKELNKSLEKEANRFAGAFLLPRETFAREIISTSLSYFIRLKERWGVSIAAMIYRCKDLGILSENQTSYLWRQMAAQKMRMHEPLDDVISEEQPTLFRDAIQLLVDEKVVSPLDILEHIQLPLKDICELCNVDESVFNLQMEPQRPRLYLVKKK